MTDMIRNKRCRFTFVLGLKLFSPKRLKRIFETLFISIAVSDQGRGIAGELIKAGFKECASRGIAQVKVLVAASNEPANKLYQKYGFKLAHQVESHGILSNIYIAETHL